MLHVSSKKTTLIIVFLSTCIFIGLLYKEYSGLNSYMDYISENGRSALFHEEYINQNLAFKLSHAFSSAHQVNSETSSACDKLETLNGVEGFNLTEHRFDSLAGTLQAANKNCYEWVADIKNLALINLVPLKKSLTYTFSNYSGYTFNNLRYYIDVEHNYIYSNQLIDTRHYIFKTWLEVDKHLLNVKKGAHNINFDASVLQGLQAGENIISHVYRDGYTKNNIISLLTPVFKDINLKGVLITDININDLAISFYTNDRPYIWKFLSMYIVDNTTGEAINFHSPSYDIKSIIHHTESITQYYTLHINLDIIYFIISNMWLIISYILATYMLCAYANYHQARNARLSTENITDVMTGLYNRKILTPALQSKIDKLQHKGVTVTVVALDCDGLKQINDTRGHLAGDHMIQALGKAIDHAIRKSDYGIRLGGDEFNIILINNTYAGAQNVVTRIENMLSGSKTDDQVKFSYGCYEMKPGESLNAAFEKADEALYLHKRSKHRR